MNTAVGSSFLSLSLRYMNLPPLKVRVRAQDRQLAPLPHHNGSRTSTSLPPPLSPTNRQRSATLLFTQVPSKEILGSSLSSGAARRFLQICHKTLKDGIGDAPLEAPQRLLTGLALRYLLAVVLPAPDVRPGLAHRNHMCRARC